MTKKYDENSIKWHQGLEGVRAKPAMYIGTPDSSGVFHIFKEIADNAIDEMGISEKGAIGVLLEDDVITVYDRGRGIPVGPHPKNKSISTLTVIFTELHAGGKMTADQGNYAFSRGTHGVGSAVTNALSEFLEVWTYRDGWYYQKFEKGKPVTKVIKKKPDIKIERGTVVRFKPDFKIFEKKSKIDSSKIKEYLDTNSYFYPKIKFGFQSGKESITYSQPQGLKALVEAKIEKLKVEKDGTVFIHQSKLADVALVWSSADDEHAQSYANAIHTLNGGTHVLGFNQIVAEVLRKYAGKRSTFRSDDLRNGLIAFVNIKIPSPQFDSQVKTKLVTKEATEAIKRELEIPLTKYFNSNKSLAKRIIQRANDIRKAFDEFKLSKKAAAELKSNVKGKLTLPKELVVSETKDPKRRELFIVEGASAGGTAKKARFSEFQEVLCLSGKPPNIYKAKLESVLGNERVLNILKSIGYDPNDQQLKNMRVGKIVILSDADEDGYHITCLVLALLYRISPKLFSENKVFVVDAPLYTAFFNNKRHFGESLNDILNKVKGVKSQNITRIKGWSEIDPPVLRQIAFDPKMRKIVKISDSKNPKHKKHFLQLMGEGVDTRKELLGL
jgi:DNA gyrase/topoisomerase IV subunit B